MKNNLGVIVGGTTFVLFMTEAIIHFHMGQNYKEVEEGKSPSPFNLPDSKELGKLALIVGIFSVMNGVIINEIKKSL
jgi:hypothetical protein|tara:strand:- start:823 stop:1053 length:231 start_codon:yes stop_codon:yes gene_type:complete